tara:strand:+ start:1194 stop:1508 length:315 start_codon:yes stop_codon:yes gene_type:complete
MVNKLFLSCFGILAVHLLRNHGFNNMILDSAPNFFAFFILVYVFKIIKVYREGSSSLIYLGSLVLLCVYEFVQSFIKDIFVFDYLDLLATILGYLTMRISYIKV